MPFILTLNPPNPIAGKQKMPRLLVLVAASLLVAGSRAFLLPSISPSSSSSTSRLAATTSLPAATARVGDVATIDLSIVLEDGTPMPADFDTGSNVRFRLGYGGLVRICSGCGWVGD